MHLLRLPLVAALLVAFWLAACSGGEGAPDVIIEFGVATPVAAERTATRAPTSTATRTAASNTPTPSPTPAAIAAGCPIAEDACVFGLRIAANLLSGRGDAILAVSRPTTYVCPGPNGGLGDPFPLCNGARTGETREGYPFLTTLQGQGSVMSEPQAVVVLADWSSRADPSLRDDFGDGAPRAYSIACPGIPPDAPRDCSDAFSFVFSGLVSSPAGPLRWMASVSVHRLDDGTLRAGAFATGVATVWDLTYPLRGGSGERSNGRLPAVLAPAFPPASTITFFPWDPATSQP